MHANLPACLQLPACGCVQALQAREVCLTSLLLSVSPSNCLSLLVLAQECGLTRLEESAMACALG